MACNHCEVRALSLPHHSSQISHYWSIVRSPALKGLELLQVIHEDLLTWGPETLCWRQILSDPAFL